MLNSFFTFKKGRSPIFQVLLLDNDANQDVEVQEAEQVDFARVQEHLAHGRSVFITSKSSQKIALPKRKKIPRNKNAKRVTAFYLDNS
jgi:hypothetical protein